MQSVLTSLFGAYAPLVDEAGAYVSGLAGVDWPWIFGVVLFIVCLKGFFSVLNSIIKG